MPELPETETIARDLDADIAGSRIDRVVVTRPDVLRETTAEDLAERVGGRTIRRAWRRAKLIVLDLSSDDRLVVRPFPEPGDERLVDLQGVGRELLQVHERRVPGAEVVEPHAHTRAAQLRDRRVRVGLVVEQDRLGDLEAQPARRHPVPVRSGRDLAGQLGVEELRSR